MRLFRTSSELSQITGAVVTIGNFDGVHRGHRKLLDAVTGQARLRQAPALAITFHPHPLTVVNPYMKIEQITPLPEKLLLLEGAGLDAVLVVGFDDRFASMDARSFVRDVLVVEAKVSGIVVGSDFAFGRNREGSVALFEELGRTCGYTVTAVPPVTDDGRVISSTAIRGFIKDGDMRSAERFLGRPYRVGGMVTRGKRMGRLLGYPTANLLVEGYLVPRKGVYAARAEMDGVTYRAVICVGPPLTFNISDFAFEVHLLDFSGGDLYGHDIKVSFVERLRGLVKFDGPEALKAQIAHDVDATERVLNR